MILFPWRIIFFRQEKGIGGGWRLFNGIILQKSGQMRDPAKRPLGNINQIIYKDP